MPGTDTSGTHAGTESEPDTHADSNAVGDAESDSDPGANARPDTGTESEPGTHAETDTVDTGAEPHTGLDSHADTESYSNAGASGAVIPSEDWNVSLKPRLVCGHAECSRIWGLE